MCGDLGCSVGLASVWMLPFNVPWVCFSVGFCLLGCTDRGAQVSSALLVSGSHSFSSACNKGALSSPANIPSLKKKHLCSCSFEGYALSAAPFWVSLHHSLLPGMSSLVLIWWFLSKFVKYFSDKLKDSKTWVGGGNVLFRLNAKIVIVEQVIIMLFFYNCIILINSGIIYCKITCCR